MALHKREDTPTNEKAGRAPVLGTTPLRHTLYDVSLGSGSSNTPGLSNGEGWIESLAALPRQPLVRCIRVRTRFRKMWPAGGASRFPILGVDMTLLNIHIARPKDCRSDDF